MPLLALGLNHATAPLDLRERVAVAERECAAATAELARQPGVREAAVISTCNRTEIYCAVEEGAESTPAQWLSTRNQLDPATLDSYLYRHYDAAAVRHLFRVATGLDSMVLGEPQILGQVKSAYHAARDAGSLQAPLDRLFQHAFSVAKRIRTDTQIGAHPVSIAFAAVRLAQQVFSELDRATVLLIGAGDTIELAARHLAEQGAKRLLVANRTLGHAQNLASRFGGYALPLAELGRHLPEADIVFSATASPTPVVTADMVRQALKARRHRPMLMLDLAVPRDIDAATAKLDDVFLYTVDDLDQVIEDNRRSRREAAEQAEAIIALQVEHFMGWWRATDRHDVLRELRLRAEQERDLALGKALEALRGGKSAELVLQQFAHALTNKFLHAPSAALRGAAMRGDLDLLQAAARLHALSDDTGSTPGKDADDTGHTS
ncbi:glutamyl-tRNA reductase [Pseudomarimonas arenosa]|uniref:Glutamyl-tRNA reductase n=1 Tax=Pseudomarimonas arenosa TaxID=2774145 RepID=A0AAW3ZJ21_9GAMM|nr:glutamyl-tRNA reductase [Pseudomarimonas arenosa]MBD8525529.1 glutamyl-tRNA reductase [Pseudomarimonas arenosa]